MIDLRVPERDAHREEDIPLNEEVDLTFADVSDPACARYFAAANSPGGLGKYARMAVKIAREHYSALKLPSNTVFGFIPNFDLLMPSGFSLLALALGVVNVCGHGTFGLVAHRGDRGSMSNIRRQLFIPVGNFNCR